MKTVKSIEDASGGVAYVLNNDGTWVKYEQHDELPNGIFGQASNNVPNEITMRQAILALYEAGILDAADAAVLALPDPPLGAAKITWEYSQTVERNNPLVLLLAEKLGMSSSELDALFIVAATR